MSVQAASLWEIDLTDANGERRTVTGSGPIVVEGGTRAVHAVRVFGLDPPMRGTSDYVGIGD